MKKINLVALIIPRWIQLMILILIIVVMPQLQTVSASPTPAVMLVNHSTKQCSHQVFLADECRSCTPTNGWEILGLADITKCPSGYIFTNSYSMSCITYPPSSTCNFSAYEATVEARKLSYEASKTPYQKTTSSTFDFSTVLFLVAIASIVTLLIMLRRDFRKRDK